MNLPFPITSPTLLIDEQICRANLKRMADKAKRNGLRLVPHFKTPQSIQIGEWVKDYGVKEITVSSLKMAAYFAEKGWEKIHIAFPFNPLEIPSLHELAKKQPLSIQLVNEETTLMLVEKLEYPISFFIEIDAGYGRTGVKVSDFGKIEAMLRLANSSDKLRFRGFYIHAGHSYHAAVEGLRVIHEQNKAALQMLKDKYRTEFPELITRTGDTPTCSMFDEFGDIDEIGPGNFMFYDLTQARIGSCRKKDIAIALAVPVVDIQKERGEILVHGGGVHLSKDVLIGPDGGRCYGEVVHLAEKGWEIAGDPSFLKSISQEHGIIKANDELMKKVKVGDVLGILPIHSCMTADCMGEYFDLSGNSLDHLKGRYFQY
ncbi:alanine racemase [Pararhodonellum marinum]|uniref:alanine racemase n=1 Tax=Pararhodonellum marinum TaxID=2755358 RepID=UPI00189006A0|nr:alanine racemase [Pararhodonellum marinum]